MCRRSGKQEANDARLLRAAIVNILEEACLPGVTDEEKKRLLSFVVGRVESSRVKLRFMRREENAIAQFLGLVFLRRVCFDLVSTIVQALIFGIRRRNWG